MLIVSLPPVHQEKLLRCIISHPLVPALRYNTGMDSAFSPRETIQKILKHSKPHRKLLYIDLKGKQLRVKEWATPPYGPIILNHKIKVEYPAKVLFRGDDCCELKNIVDENKIYVDPLPKYPVGKGQSVNILTKNLEVNGCLTGNDYAYIEAAVNEKVPRFMLSFVDSLDYVNEFESVLKSYFKGKKLYGYELVLKIESLAGVKFVRNFDNNFFPKYRLMAARDDLMIQIGGLKMIRSLKAMVTKDPQAICASRLLLGLEYTGNIVWGDIADICLMNKLGYKNFMLSDGISRKYFKQAIRFWKKYSDIV